MDLVYTWYGNRYWSQIFSSSINSHDHNLGVKVTDLNSYVKFLFLIFYSSLLLYLWMDLVYTWYGNRYWSQSLSSSISSHDHNLGVKVTDSTFMLLFALKIFDDYLVAFR